MEGSGTNWWLAILLAAAIAVELAQRGDPTTQAVRRHGRRFRPRLLEEFVEGLLL